MYRVRLGSDIVGIVFTRLLLDGFHLRLDRLDLPNSFRVFVLVPATTPARQTRGGITSRPGLVMHTVHRASMHGVPRGI